MRRRLGLLAALVALAHLPAPALAAPPPQVQARAWLVVNAGTGERLTGANARMPVPIASITKLMTVLVVLERRGLDELVTVDPRAAAVGQESIPLQAGEQLAVRELVRAALIQSANNAADALALSVAPDFPAFAALMNAKAHELGLGDSHFVRPDGLDAPGAVSSARDVTRLAQAAMRIPFVRETVRQVTATIEGGRTLHTWNDLLSLVPGLFGVKTGHTNGAGWSEVAAVRGEAGTTIYATILGSPSRAQRNADLQTLLAWGLSEYRVVDAVSASRTYAQARLPFGRGTVAIVAKRSLRLVVRPGRPLVERVVAPTALELPVGRGEVVGRVEIWSQGKLLGRRPLVAARPVESPAPQARLGWYARRTVHNVVGLLR
jgi:serine-type D-Ala-D-Ala carboxypeptidase (penicillin-binding protein 5/6)